MTRIVINEETFILFEIHQTDKSKGLVKKKNGEVICLVNQ